MGSSIFDWLGGNYTASTAQSQEAAKYADDAYTAQTGGYNWATDHNSSNQGIDALPTTTGQARALDEYNSQIGPVQQSPWLSQGSAATGGGGATPPTYSANGLSQMGNGQVNYSGNDQGLLATLNSAGAGDMTYGTAAFGIGNNYASMQNLANQLGFDSSPYKTTGSLRIALDDQLKDYFRINGLSQGWNDTGNARGANNTLYQRVDGQLVPVSTNSYESREKGNWVEEHPGILAPLGVAAGGLAAMYSAPAAGASAGATQGAAAGGAAAGSGSAGASAGAAAGTGAAAGSGGIGGTIANALGLGSQWGSLPAWGQAAITNGGMGALNSGLRGGNILEGALLGGISGGVGSGLTGQLASTGMSQGLASGLGRLGGGLVSGGAGMALNGGGDLGSLLASSALNFGAGQAGNALGLGSILGPQDNSLQGILARLAAQQGGSALASRFDPRLGSLGGMAGTTLASLYRNA